ncbi:GNAT family N-acetyltransferase [Streptomyces sioyaensis]|uniref:GNAT family N-acetyltransferase n=1 Tax=Streptomyces sioyaensis TaxID=67364 RepID=A0A4Q1R0X8_9ACTN|nr:GNAT family N-acetyltransferase [Streptomyces sioyaensis]MBM4791901.1 GNAT family N-acetyltransferase [Streptomyces sioyaensis]RXS68246.1 GNAT family N-acetyltransferase [Streptomyces sioyaensis]
MPTLGNAPDPQPVTGELTVTTAALDDWHQVAQWAADEEWNPGRGDTACFHPTDPAGFFVGRRDGRTVSAVSVVNYSDAYAFLGYYLVHPDHRRQGLGLATWRAAVPHAGARTVGLDAVPAQQHTYERAGFTPAYETIRYGGRPAGPGTLPPEVVPVTGAHLDAVAGYDRRCFPADRRAFVTRWLTAPGHTARVFLRDGAVAGYGVIRPARTGHRIGPLFADTTEAAEALFDALAATAGPDAEVFLDIPGPRHAAHTLATTRGLTPQSHTVRMYTGPVPPAEQERTFAVTSLELG